MKRKLIVFSIILILVSVLVTSFISIRANLNNAQAQYTAELEVYARLINKTIEEELMIGITPQYSRYATDFGQAIGERVTLIDANGAVIGDSEAGEAYSQMENHQYRQEVKAALQGNIGVSVRESVTYGKQYVYVAAPLMLDGKVIMISRVAMELDQVMIINDFIIRNAAVSAVIGILLAIFLSILFAGLITRPVRSILDTASKIAEGHYEERIFIKTGDELEDIAKKINEVAEKLSHSIYELTDNSSKKLSVLSSMKEAIIAVDHHFNIILINNAAKDMFHLEDSVVGEYLLRAVRSSQLYEAFRKVEEEKFIGEQEIDFGNDRIYRIKTVYITSDEQTQAQGIMALIEDITEFKKLENIRREFVANVSHELKTPLTSISGFVETLQAGAAEDPELRHKFLDIISIESARLKRLIEDILIISDIERGREQRTGERIDLSKAIEETLESIAPIIAEKQTKIHKEFIGDGLFVTGNPDRFKQMMVNLIENAVKYSKPGSDVYIKAERKYNKIQISIRDNGYGIPAEHLPRLFERFYRVDRSRSQKEGGTGLGLAIVKHIVHLFEGEIYVTSKVGEGTEFTIII